MSWLGRVALGSFLLLITVWAAVFWTIAAYSFTARPIEADLAGYDAIVCLGAGMSRTQGWDMPDDASLRRALTCAELYDRGVAPVVIFTGYGNRVSSAAAAMARAAEDAGLPPDAALLEEASRSTLQNAVFSMDLLPADARDFVLVSDAFHLPRSWVIFKALGGQTVTVYPAHRRGVDGIDRDGRSMIVWLMRETTATLYNTARLSLYLTAGAFGIDEDVRAGWFN